MIFKLSRFYRTSSILILIIAVVLRVVNGIDGAIAPLFVEFIGICTTMIVGMQLVSVVTLLSRQN